MVKLSDKTIELLKEDILSILNENPLKSRFTKEISLELRRDKEFTLKLLLEMKMMLLNLTNQQPSQHILRLIILGVMVLYYHY